MNNTNNELVAISDRKLRAAAYVRMSTESQKYSIENQMAAINKYADENRVFVTRVFADPGISGLTFEKRPGLRSLIEAVQSRQADFSHILVLDISRWGRFQDVDESAYYEYMCRREGVDVHYVAEQFQNDHLPLSAILKAIKRAMAGEYSRELSAKIIASKRRIVEKGFRPDGRPAGYGLRRAAIDSAGNFKYVLRFSQQKKRSERVILVPGPKNEVAIVRKIYKWFIEDKYDQRKIAKLLNEKRVKLGSGRKWSYDSVRAILRHEKYIGNNVYNMSQCRLGKQKGLPKESWQRVEGAFEAIVPREIYFQAQKRLSEIRSKLSDEQLLDALRGLIKKNGKLTDRIINQSSGPMVGVYTHRFGTLMNAYDLIGYKPTANFTHRLLAKKTIEIAKESELLFEKLLTKNNLIFCKWKRSRWKHYRINDKFTVVPIVFTCALTQFGHMRWAKSCFAKTSCDYILAICTDSKNSLPESYYLIPTSEMRLNRLQFPTMRTLKVENYIFHSLEMLCDALQKI